MIAVELWEVDLRNSGDRLAATPFEKSILSKLLKCQEVMGEELESDPLRLSSFFPDFRCCWGLLKHVHRRQPSHTTPCYSSKMRDQESDTHRE